MLINLRTRQPPATPDAPADGKAIPVARLPPPRAVPKPTPNPKPQQLDQCRPGASAQLRLAEEHLPRLLAAGLAPAGRNRLSWYRKMLQKEADVDFDPFVADCRDFEAEVRLALAAHKSGEQAFLGFVQAYRFVRSSPFERAAPSHPAESNENRAMKQLSEQLVGFVKSLLKLDCSQRLKPLVAAVTKQISLYPLERHLAICLHLEMVDSRPRSLFYFPYFDELLNFITNPSLFLACHKLLLLARKALAVTSAIESVASYKVQARFGEEEGQTGPATLQHPTDPTINLIAITEDFLPLGKPRRRIVPSLPELPRDSSKQYDLYFPSIVEVCVDGSTVLCDDILLVFLQQKRVVYDKSMADERDIYFEVVADHYVASKVVDFHAATNTYELRSGELAGDLTIWRSYPALDRLLQHLAVASGADAHLHQSSIMYSLKQLRQATKAQLFGLLSQRQPVDRAQFDAALARLETNGFISVEGENLKFIP